MGLNNTNNKGRYRHILQYKIVHKIYYDYSVIMSPKHLQKKPTKKVSFASPKARHIISASQYFILFYLRNILLLIVRDC